MTDERDPNFKWREGAAALASLENIAEQRRMNQHWLDGNEPELRKAIRVARDAGVPEEAIEEIAGLDHAEVDRIAGTVDQPDPGSELANAKVHALAQLEHLRRELAYNYPAVKIREKRRVADSAITDYCKALDAAQRRARLVPAQETA
jgi:hypothetical protein